MNLKDIQMLKDCVMFTIDNDADLDEQDVKNLWAINMRLNNMIQFQYTTIHYIGRLTNAN